MIIISIIVISIMMMSLVIIMSVSLSRACCGKVRFSKNTLGAFVSKFALLGGGGISACVAFALRGPWVV